MLYPSFHYFHVLIQAAVTCAQPEYHCLFSPIEAVNVVLDLAHPFFWSVFDIFVTRSQIEASPHLIRGLLLFKAIHNVVETLAFQAVLGQTNQCCMQGL